MSSKVDCPLCGRRLALPESPGLMTCDGCEGQFDPRMLIYRPAPLGRRIIGMVVVFLGFAVLVRPPFAAILLLSRVDGDVMGRLGGRLIFAAALILWGFSLTRGRMTLQRMDG